MKQQRLKDSLNIIPVFVIPLQIIMGKHERRRLSAGSIKEDYRGIIVMKKGFNSLVIMIELGLDMEIVRIE